VGLYDYLVYFGDVLLVDFEVDLDVDFEVDFEVDGE
jgi:hypothetical protein